jgi:multidrug efflux pump subunit AcrB
MSHGRAAVVAIVALALLALVAYTGYAGTTVYRQLDSGRQELVAAQASMAAAARSGDTEELRASADQLRHAERDFKDAGGRARNDPALRLVGGIPAAGRNLDAVTHLAAIGANMSRAGEAASAVAIQVAALKQQYAGRTLTPDDLQLILQQAQDIAKDYGTSTQAIGQQLRAAHAERAQVTTADLVDPLRNAYDAVDAALANADNAFLRFQDVRQLLSDYLGVRLPT